MTGINWTDFIIGGVSAMFLFALFTADNDREEEEFDQGNTNNTNNVVVTDFSRKLHQISCQTCRKMKNHREVAPRIFECTRCHRRTDLSSTG
jgi:hypothetical protein